MAKFRATFCCSETYKNCLTKVLWNLGFYGKYRNKEIIIDDTPRVVWIVYDGTECKGFRKRKGVF